MKKKESTKITRVNGRGKVLSRCWVSRALISHLVMSVMPFTIRLTCSLSKWLSESANEFGNNFFNFKYLTKMLVFAYLLEKYHFLYSSIANSYFWGYCRNFLSWNHSSISYFDPQESPHAKLQELRLMGSGHDLDKIGAFQVGSKQRKSNLRG